MKFNGIHIGGHEVGPVNEEFVVNEELARSYRPYALTLLGDMKMRMQLRGLNQLIEDYRLNDGTLIRLSSILAYDEVSQDIDRIYIESPLTEVEEVSPYEVRSVIVIFGRLTSDFLPDDPSWEEPGDQEFYLNDSFVARATGSEMGTIYLGSETSRPCVVISSIQDVNNLDLSNIMIANTSFSAGPSYDFISYTSGGLKELFESANHFPWPSFSVADPIHTIGSDILLTDVGRGVAEGFFNNTSGGDGPLVVQLPSDEIRQNLTTIFILSRMENGSLWVNTYITQTETRTDSPIAPKGVQFGYVYVPGLPSWNGFTA